MNDKNKTKEKVLRCVYTMIVPPNSLGYWSPGTEYTVQMPTQAKGSRFCECLVGGKSIVDYCTIYGSNVLLRLRGLHATDLALKFYREE